MENSLIRPLERESIGDSGYFMSNRSGGSLAHSCHAGRGRHGFGLIVCLFKDLFRFFADVSVLVRLAKDAAVVEPCQDPAADKM